MSKGSFRPAIPGDGDWLAPRLREADRAEFLAVAGITPEAGLEDGLAAADAAWTIVSRKGERVGVFGVTGFAPNVGLVWLLATPGILPEATTFLRNCRPVVDHLHSLYPALVNWADERNTVHHRWLKWCGFTIFGRSPRFGVAQLPFLQFGKVKHLPCVCP
jgi:hypothetical protein